MKIVIRKSINHKYYKREGVKGNYKYYYTKEEYEKEHSKKEVPENKPKPLKQTETKEFKEWFGDSKVVNDKGEPLVVYHGTNADFSKFDFSKNRDVRNKQFQGNGFFFSYSPKTASDYAEAQINHAFDKNIIFNEIKKKYPKYISDWFQNVVNLGFKKGWDKTKSNYPDFFNKLKEFEKVHKEFDINDLTDISEYVFGTVKDDDDENNDSFFNIWGGISEIPDYIKEKAFQYGLIESIPKFNVMPVYLKAEKILKTNNREKAKKAQSLGYDAVIYNGEDTVNKEPEIIVFNSTQIKSATGNNGKFDKNNPDITKSNLIDLIKSRKAEPIGAISKDGKRKKISINKWIEIKKNNKKSLKQTETKEFKEWFGDSKVVNDKGEPLVVYHGTNADFNEFKTESIKIDNLGKGFYFTDDAEIASSYSQNRTKERGGYSSVIKTYLKIENPFDTRNITKKQAESYLTYYYSLSKYINEKQQKEAVISELNDVDGDYSLIFPNNLGDKDVQNWLKNENYDGLIIAGQDKYSKKEGLAYIVFNSTQIKSATGNNGKFDKNNPDITKSIINYKKRLINLALRKGDVKILSELYENWNQNNYKKPSYESVKEFFENNYEDYSNDDELINNLLQYLQKKIKKSTELMPTENQIKAGNYKKEHITIQGLPIAIENKKGTIRSGIDSNGKKWSIKMKNDYGYFNRTEGKDGDQIDVFIGNNIESDRVFVVDQYINGVFDESKVMLGFDNSEQAKKAYLSNYNSNWKGLKYISEININEFKKWLKDGKRQYKPFKKYKSMKIIIRKSINIDLFKGRKAEPIGAISKDGKRKKISENNWVDILENKQSNSKLFDLANELNIDDNINEKKDWRNKSKKMSVMHGITTSKNLLKEKNKDIFNQINFFDKNNKIELLDNKNNKYIIEKENYKSTNPTGNSQLYEIIKINKNGSKSKLSSRMSNPKLLAEYLNDYIKQEYGLNIVFVKEIKREIKENSNNDIISNFKNKMMKFINKEMSNKKNLDDTQKKNALYYAKDDFKRFFLKPALIRGEITENDIDLILNKSMKIIIRKSIMN